MNSDIVILVGTDHHPFTRLITWSDEWVRNRRDASIFVQYGYSPPPHFAPGAPFLTPEELRAKIDDSRVVVTHGGPGTVMDARTGGHHPIMMPRDPSHGEHVDGHQQQFSKWAAQKGLAKVVIDVETLSEVVEQELRSPTSVVPHTQVSLVATDRLTELITTHKAAQTRGISARIPFWQRRRTTRL